MTRRKLLLLLTLPAALAMVGFGYVRATASPPDLKALTVEEVAAKIALHDGKTFIYDNNDKGTYAEGHVPTARWIAFNEVTAASLAPDKSANLVFYCAHEL